MDCVTLNFNNGMSIDVMLFNIKKAFHTTWHTDLLHINYLNWNLPLVSNILVLFLHITNSEFRWKVKCKQGCIKVRLSFTLHSMYIDDAPQTSHFHLALFAGNIRLYVTDHKGVLFSQNCSVVTVQWRHSVSTGKLK